MLLLLRVLFLLSHLFFVILQWGGRRYEDVQKTAVWCTALEGVECFGNRKFLKDGFPCIK